MIGAALAGLGREFAALDREGIFLNSASVGPMPDRSVRVLEQCNRDRARPSAWPVERMLEILRTAREHTAKLIGADADEIALMTNTTTGLNVAIHALPLGPGDVVVTFDGEFPSNVYPVLALASRGVTLERIPRTGDGWPDEPALLERITDPRVKAVVVSLTQFANGYTVDLGALSRVARANDVWLVVDAIQAIGHTPVDVRATPVDFLACGAQKWLLSPWGTGFLYVRRELCQRFMPTFAGWASFEGTDDYTRLTAYDPRPWPDARRFELITLPVQDFAAMNSSVELLLDIGAAAVGAHARSLHEPIRAWAERAGAPITSPTGERGSAILCVRPPDLHAAYSRLVHAGVQCSLREGAIRLSPHIFNTLDQMEQVAMLMDG